MPKTYKLSQIPSVDEYVQAFIALKDKVTDRQVAILREQYRAPARTASATALGEAVGCHRVVVNGAYGRLGHNLADEIGLKPSKREVGAYRWWSLLSEGYSYKHTFLWKMHEQVAQALEKLNIVEPDIAYLPEEIDVDDQLTEGSVRRVSINAYERSPAARERCLEHHGLACAVCGMNFGETYGPKAEGLIHVHHRIPIAEIGELYEVDPMRDLVPVCPNCHAAIHRSNPPYSIAEVREMLARHSNSGSK